MKRSISDRELIDLLQSDPARGLEQAIDRYGGAVKTICAAILGANRPEEVEEAVSDSFVALWRGLARYDPARPLTGWVYGIARRTALSRRRAVERAGQWEALPEALEAPDADPADRAAARQQADRLRRAIGQLSQPDREILVRRYYLYQTVNEIAAAMSLAPKAVENKLCRTRQRLRRKLQKGGDL